MAGKSIIPDLIFTCARQERVQEIGTLYSKKQLFSPSVAPILHRATVFVTHRCNFRCVYCNGPHVSKTILSGERKDFLSREMTPGLFGHLLEDWRKNGLKYLHFTGGEATLNRDLPGFIRKASGQGIVSAITTNGSADPALYAEMVENGLKEIRISIDSHEPGRFNEIVRVPGAFSRVERTIRELVKLRDQGRDIFIIFNICMQAFDLEECKSTIRGLLRYRPDDMKLLVIAETAARIEEKASRRAVDELLALVREIPRGFELLERKLHTLFRKDNFGLKSMAVRHLMNHCLVPITERTVDAKYVYPCSIYLRYRGEPLAPVTADFGEQQKASVAFAAHHNCRRDPICSVNCTTCCRDFNVEANKRMDEIRIAELSKKYPVIDIPRISEEEENDVRGKFEEINRRTIPETYPFFVIKPLGMPKKKEILRYLEEQGVEILTKTRIRDWFDFTLFLYFKEKYLSDSGRVRFKIACNRAFKTLEKPGGMVLRLEKHVPFSKMYRIKAELREWFGDGHRIMRYDGELITLHLNAIHSPDSLELEWQNKVIEYFQSPSQTSLSLK